MYQRPDDNFVTPLTCDLHHKLVESKIEAVAVRCQSLEDKVTGIEHRIDMRMDAMDLKIEKILSLQENTYKILIYLAIGTIITLIGVVLGRALDFGWVMGF